MSYDAYTCRVCGGGTNRGPVCHDCDYAQREHRLRLIFDQVRLMTPENELYFVLQLLIGTSKEKIETAEQLLQEMRANGRSYP